MCRRVGRKYAIKEVLDFIIPLDLRKNAEGFYKQYGDFMVKMQSQRYTLFKEKSTTCVKCGLEGEYFALDFPEPLKDRNGNIIEITRPHFNLYGIDDKGNEVLLTKDHIIPKSKGGKNHMSNYQTMCTECNKEKGNTI